MQNDCTSSYSGSSSNIDAHIPEQERFEFDVILAGFTSKPDAEIVVEKLLQLFQISKQSVKSSRSFEVRRKFNRGYNGYAVITFKDKASKAKLMSEISKSKAIKLSQFTTLGNDQDDPIITCTHHFSKFNFTVGKHLKDLLSWGIISEFTFNGSNFLFRKNSKANVTEVTDMAILEPLYNLLTLTRNLHPRKSRKSVATSEVQTVSTKQTSNDSQKSGHIKNE